MDFVEEYDYGFEKNEGDPFLVDQPPAPEIVELLQSKADSFHLENFRLQSPSETLVVITSILQPQHQDQTISTLFMSPFPIDNLG
jgi:hypothetical protein